MGKYKWVLASKEESRCKRYPGRLLGGVVESIPFGLVCVGGMRVRAPFKHHNMQDTRVCDLTTHTKTIHVVKRDDTIGQVLDTLYKYDITAVPVIDYESKVHGMLDNLDLLAFLVNITSQGKRPVSQVLAREDLEQFYETSKNWTLSTVDQGKSVLESLGQRNPWLPCTTGVPLSAVLQVFADGIHRLPVVNSDAPNEVVNIITQSDVNCFLAQDPLKYLAAKAEATLQDLHLLQGEQAISKVTADVPAIDAFVKMYDEERSSIAVVDASGILLGCISATDLKYIRNFNFQQLLRPSFDFIQEVRKNQAKVKDYLVTVPPTATLQDVVTTLAKKRVHRLYVINEENHPIGLVSLTDIAKVLSSATH
ncbi:cell separation during budding [Balamuthia mandrillaris]